MVKFLRNLNISVDDVKAILNNELDFKECLEINQIHLEKQIKSLEEVQEKIYQCYQLYNKSKEKRRIIN